MLVLLAIRHERLSLTRLGSKNNRQGRPLEVAEGAHLTPNFQNLRATRCFVSGVEAPGKQGCRPPLCQSALAGTETPLLRLFHPFPGPCPSVHQTLASVPEKAQRVTLLPWPSCTKYVSNCPAAHSDLILWMRHHCLYANDLSRSSHLPFLSGSSVRSSTTHLRTSSVASAEKVPSTFAVAKAQPMRA